MRRRRSGSGVSGRGELGQEVVETGRDVFESVAEEVIDEETIAKLLASIGGIVIGEGIRGFNRDFGIAMISASAAFGINEFLESITVGLTRSEALAVTSAGSTLMTPLMSGQEARMVSTGVNVCNTIRSSMR